MIPRLNREFFRENQGTVIAIAICVIALVLRAWGYRYGLPILYNGDEGQLVQRAVRFGSGDLNPHNFIYPSFYKYVLFVCYGFYFVIGKLFGIFGSVTDFKHSYFSDPSAFYIIGRLISAIAGSLTVFYVYLTGKRFRCVAVGLLAALFFSLEHEHFRFSHFAKPDALMTLLVVMATYYTFRMYDEGRLTDYIFAGALGGLAVSTKYNAVFVVVAIATAHVLRHVQKPSLEELKKAKWHLLGLSGVSFLLLFFLGTPFALLDFKTFLQDIKFQQLVVTQEQSIATFVATILAYVKTLFLPAQFSLNAKFFGIFIILGTIKALVRPRKRDLIILLFLVVHFLFFTFKTSSSFVKLHYLLPILSLFYLLGASFFWESIQAIRLRVHYKKLLLAALLLILVFHPFKRLVLADYARVQMDTGNLARGWVEDHIPGSAKILIASAHNLALKQSKESLLENNGSAVQNASKDKIDALVNYSGKSYHLSYLYHGWGFVSEDKLEEITEVPKGIQLIDRQKLSLDYWKDREIEYVIVFSTLDENGNPKEVKHEMFRGFFEELSRSAVLVKEFLSDYPKRPGFPVRIYHLKS